MKPKRTIVVRGSPESCQALQNFCLSTGNLTVAMVEGYALHLWFLVTGSADNKAFIAKKGETIDATIESHIYQVRLKDSLLSSLVFGRARDAEVAWIDARLTYQVLIFDNYVTFRKNPNFLHDNRRKTYETWMTRKMFHYVKSKLHFWNHWNQKM